jgi:tight adherence protein C
MSAIERGQLVINFAYLLLGSAVFMLVRMLMAEQESRAALENLEDQRGRAASFPFVKILRPFYSQYIVPMIRGRPSWEKKRKHWRRLLIAGGVKEEFTPDEFIAFKLIFIIFLPIIMGLLQVGGLIDLSTYIIVGAGIGGWFLPNFLLSGRVEARQKQVIRAMPFIVDLLALSTEAGLDFVGAMAKVVEKAKPSPLVEEFSQLLKEIKVGASRQDALREMAARIAMSEINSFVAILISADQMGASIGKILRQQSEQIRNQRMLAAEKAGAAAASKVILPLVIFILPAVMIMIFAPFGLGMVYGPQ